MTDRFYAGQEDYIQKLNEFDADLQAAIAAAERTLLSGDDAPSDAAGIDGDFYIDKAAWVIYGPKASGTWPAGTSLIGPQGDQGIQGEQGNQGIQGVQGEQGDQGLQGIQGPQGIQGETGASAYEVAVANGFVGDESQWLDSLVGPQGEQGLQGDEGPQGIQGAQGDSAYEAAVQNGFVGTEAEWLDSLVGPQGEQGPQGIQGEQGPAGSLDGLTGSHINAALGYTAANAADVPGNTDDVSEGATNQYFTTARVRAVALDGLSLLTNAAITAADTVLSAFGKLQKQITDHLANVANPHGVTAAQIGLGDANNTSDLDKPISTATQTALNAKQATLVSGTNIKTFNGASLLGSGDIAAPAGNPAWLIKTANYNAATGDQIFCDTAGASFTVYLPATPNAGDSVRVKVADDSATTNDLTVDGNGNGIEGGFISDTSVNNGEDRTLVFDGSYWRL